jgi:sigma-B regulation protein RsbU (phosphoserine phosphatase)
MDRIACAILLAFLMGMVVRTVLGPFPGGSWINVAAILAGVYMAARLLPWLRTKLLWSLRSRLVVAYIFIAVVPIVLVLTMAALSSYLLYLQFGAHLIDDEFQQRMSTVSNTANALLGTIRNQPESVGSTDADLMARPTVASVMDVARQRVPDLRVTVQRGRGIPLRGEHANEDELAGVFEVDSRLYLRAIACGNTPDGFETVTASAPLSAETLDALSPDLGPIQLTIMRLASASEHNGLVVEMKDRRFVPAGKISSQHRHLHPAANWLDIRIDGNSIFEAMFVAPGGQQVFAAPVLVSFSVRPSQINRRLFASLGALGDPLVLALSVIGVVFLLLEAAALATGVVLTRTITHTVADLYDATQHVRQGDLAHRVRIQRRDQLGVLGESFNSMTSSIGSLIAEQRQKERLENEISIAREVQVQLFPQNLPEIPGMEVAAVCRAARTVSGDYYDFLSLSPTRAGIALADISGKGISAALLMASLQAALRSQVQQDGSSDTARLVARLNRHLFLNTSDDRYATFFYSTYDAETRRLTYTNAGHLPPLYICGDRVQRLDQGGTVIGLFDNCVYAEGSLTVEPGSLMVAFSDGLVEPENVYGEDFGMQRLTEEVLRHRSGSPERLAEEVLAAVENWAGAQEQADDMTVVVVHWKDDVKA